MPDAAATSVPPGHDGDKASPYECNICLEHCVDDPVVTFCGHLFCWPCLFRWLRSGHNVCPVCKAGVSRETVIPLFGRSLDRPTIRTPTSNRPDLGGPEALHAPSSSDEGADDAPPVAPAHCDPASARAAPSPVSAVGAPTPPVEEPVPSRPAAQRPVAPPIPGAGAPAWAWGGVGQNGVPETVAFTTAFGFFPSLFALQFTTIGLERPRNAGPPSREEEHQLMLSRALFLLGSAAVLFLLFL